MYERFTDRARKVMQLANMEAQRFNHEYIGTEHMLLGLIKAAGGVAANVLKNLDVDLRKVRFEVEKLVRSGPAMVTMGKLPLTPRAKKAVELAMEASRALNHNYVGTEHILLGLLREQEGVAAQVLMNLKIDLKQVYDETCNLVGANPREPMRFVVKERMRNVAHVVAALFANGANAGTITLRCDEYDRFCALLAAGGQVRELHTVVAIGDEKDES